MNLAFRSQPIKAKVEVSLRNGVTVHYSDGTEQENMGLGKLLLSVERPTLVPDAGVLNSKPGILILSLSGESI